MPRNKQQPTQARVGSCADFARQCGVTAATISRQLKAGTLDSAITNMSEYKNGNPPVINLDKAALLYAPNPIAVSAQKPLGAAPLPAPVINLPLDDGGDALAAGRPVSDVERLNKAKADKEEVLAQQEKLKLERMRNDVIEISAVQRILFTVARETRNAMLSIPQIFAPTLQEKLSTEQTLFKLQQVIEKRCQEMSDVDNLLAKMLADIDADDGDLGQ